MDVKVKIHRYYISFLYLASFVSVLLADYFAVYLNIMRYNDFMYYKKLSFYDAIFSITPFLITFEGTALTIAVTALAAFISIGFIFIFAFSKHEKNSFTKI